MTKEKKSRQLPIREPVVLPFAPDIPIERINEAVNEVFKKYLAEKNSQTPTNSDHTKNPQNGD